MVAEKGIDMDNITTLWGVMLIVFGIITSVIDIKTKKVPNSLVLVMFIAWLLTMTPMLFINTQEATTKIFDSGLGFLLGGGLLLLVYVISRKGLGGGDVKFMAAAGLYLGFYSVIPAMFFGSVLAALTVLTLLLLKKMKRKDTIPLTPFLSIGMIVAVLLR